MRSFAFARASASTLRRSCSAANSFSLPSALARSSASSASRSRATRSASFHFAFMASRAFLPASPSASAPSIGVSSCWPSAVDSPAVWVVVSAAWSAASVVASSAMVISRCEGRPSPLAGGGGSEDVAVEAQQPQVVLAAVRDLGYRLGHQTRCTPGAVPLAAADHLALTAHITRPAHRLVGAASTGGALKRDVDLSARDRHRTHPAALRSPHAAPGVDHLVDVRTSADRLGARLGKDPVLLLRAQRLEVRLGVGG